MLKSSGKYKRRTGTKRYRDLFVIATEGKVTERIYFEHLNKLSDISIMVKHLKSDSASAPAKVLKRMRNHLKAEHLKKGDEAWLVVDKDDWRDDQLNALSRWAESDKRYGLAVSNPKFEYWLLLHFDEGNGVSTSRQCSERLRKELPNYDKSFDKNCITKTNIKEAVGRAERRDTPPIEDWPRQTGTTVYRLVKKILIR